MRMWLVDPKKLCRKHLLGEHSELHMLVATLKRGHSIRGFMMAGLIDPTKIQERHQVLVSEMNRRGYKHFSPIPEVDISYTRIYPQNPVNIINNERELSRRCVDCRKRLGE